MGVALPSEDMVNRGKLKQVITTAIARELAGFIWAIAREVKPTTI